YYKGVIPYDSKMKVADPVTKEAYRYRVNVTKGDQPEPLTAEFLLRAANPELDNTKPDLVAMTAAASTIKEVLDKESDPAKRTQIAADLGVTDEEVRSGKA